MDLPLSTLTKDIAVKPDGRKVKKITKPRLNDPLTYREVEIWIKMSQTGFSKKQLAEHFNLSVKTIDAHLYTVFIKLGVHSSSELITLAWSRGICTTTKEDILDTLNKLSILNKLEDAIEEAKRVVAEIKLCQVNTAIHTIK